MAILDFEKRPQTTAQAFNEDEVIGNFGELIKRSEKARTNQNLRSVIAKLEENIKDNEKYIIKMFLVNNKTGSMINSDNAPNISFRVDTINSIFDSIVESLIGLELSEEQIAQIFFKAGQRCGENFGQTFNNYVATYIDVTEYEEKIHEWCAFDSSVGWGKLSYRPQEKAIVITNNFQAKLHDATGKAPRDCNFFKGYISGVLSKISGRHRLPAISCGNGDQCPKCTECRECVIKID